MNEIEWSEDFNTGINWIDRQHQRIVSIINRLDKSIGAPVNSEIIEELINDISRYSREHLADEEKFLQQKNYSKYKEHLAIHQSYRMELANLCFAVTEHDTDAVEKLHGFLNRWWTKHILVEDMAYAGELSSQ